jgi:hypothetical protein
MLARECGYAATASMELFDGLQPPFSISVACPSGGRFEIHEPSLPDCYPRENMYPEYRLQFNDADSQSKGG